MLHPTRQNSSWKSHETSPAGIGCRLTNPPDFFGYITSSSRHSRSLAEPAYILTCSSVNSTSTVLHCHRELAVELQRDVLPTLDKLGVKLFFVSIGSAERGREFAALTGFPEDRLLADPDSQTYRAMGWYNSISKTFFSIQVRPTATLSRTSFSMYVHPTALFPKLFAALKYARALKYWRCDLHWASSVLCINANRFSQPMFEVPQGPRLWRSDERHRMQKPIWFTNALVLNADAAVPAQAPAGKRPEGAQGGAQQLEALDSTEIQAGTSLLYLHYCTCFRLPFTVHLHIPSSGSPVIVSPLWVTMRIPACGHQRLHGIMLANIQSHRH